SNLHDADLSWVIKLDKDDFIGRWSLERAGQPGQEHGYKLVGFKLPGKIAPDEASLVIHNGKLGGRVTSARYSPHVDAVVGLAWVPIEKSKDGERIEIQFSGQMLTATVQHEPFYDPKELKLRC
ncbi:MAG: aminomethyl transferase family protein, partial [Planctomycetes bacterium]|nr:aminomethyl transferase family protein [Planctomycetota bacterium]